MTNKDEVGDTIKDAFIHDPYEKTLAFKIKGEIPDHKLPLFKKGDIVEVLTQTYLLGGSLHYRVAGTPKRVYEMIQDYDKGFNIGVTWNYRLETDVGIVHRMEEELKLVARGDDRMYVLIGKSSRGEPVYGVLAIEDGVSVITPVDGIPDMVIEAVMGGGYDD